MKRWKKAALITVGIVLLLAGFVAFVLPGIVKSQAVQRVEAATGRKLAIGGISINPFTWTIEVRDFRFSERGGGETFAAFSSARISVSPVTLYRRAPIISAAHITSPHFRIVRVGANLYNFTDLLKFLPLHPRLSVNNLTITNGSVDFIDRGLPVEKRHELRKVELAVPFITTMPYFADRYVTPRLSAVVNGSPLHLEGKLRPFPRAVEASATIELKDVSIPHYLAYLPGVLPVQIESGRASAKVAVSYRAAQKENPELTLNGSVTLADMKVADRTGAPFLAVTQLDAEIARARLLALDFNLSSLTADGLEVFLTRDKKGVWSHSRLSVRASPDAAPRRKVLVSVTESRLRNGRFHFIDSHPPGGFRTDMEGISLDMQDYSTSPGKRASYTLSFSTLRGEKGSLKGEFSPRPLTTSSSVELTGVKLAAYAPYFPENLDIVVAGGKVDARLTVSLAARENRLTGTFGGSGGIRSLYCLDAEGEDLLKWESLQLDKMKVSLDPFVFNIGDVALTRFYSRIVVEKDGSLNLQHLYTRKPKGAVKDTAAGGKGRMVRIGTVILQNGTLAFTDHHVPGGYTTSLFNLGGRISGLSSEENRFADVDLRGNLQNQSPLRITGQINPLRADLFADLKVSFTDIELSPMTPYSGTYLGYAVDKGQLSLNSRYRIENRKIDSENKVLINQFQFGKRIESDKATTLPVRLAVALLKDRKGDIRLDLPMTGRTDNPQFIVWRVVLNDLKNLVLTAATHPFTLLRSMFGWKEDVRSVGFAYGSAELSPGEREKLLKLATALDDRPALKIVVVGFVDRERDDEGYRNELLLKKMRAEKFLDMVKEQKNRPGDSPETMQIAPEEYARYLKAVYAKEKFPKPRNILGLIKALPDTEMKKLILANTVVGEQQLRSLAEARAAGVRTFFVEHGKIDSARVIQKSGDIYRAPEKEGEPGSRVEFEVAVE